jgi:hypothetical protein
MNRGAADRLERLGLDVRFLVWLEGRGQRLPRVDRIGKVSGAKLANAVRSAAWLGSQFARPDRIAPDSPEQWLERYQILQSFFWNALRQSMTGRSLERSRDLKDLQEVMRELLPPRTREQYLADIRKLREHGQPVRLQNQKGQLRGQRTGGRRQAEQIDRMRAAVTHIGSKSNNRFRDLANLWNECVEGANYEPESMRQQLRKGEQAGEQLVEFWMRIYRGDLRAVFPGEYPNTT